MTPDKQLPASLWDEFMKLAIIADIHDNLPNLGKALGFIRSQRIDVLLCLGDLTNADTLDFLASNFTKPIYIVRGNACSYTQDDLEKYKKIVNLGRAGGISKIGNHKIGLCHEPGLMAKLIEQEPDIIFYGHTHKPWSSFAEASGDKENTETGKIQLINPGNISNTSYSPTFAIYDTDTQELTLKLIDEIK